MEEKVVNFHFLLVYHSYLSDPVFGDPCAYGGGDEDLKEGDSQGYLVCLVLETLKDEHFHDGNGSGWSGCSTLIVGASGIRVFKLSVSKLSFNHNSSAHSLLWLL